MFRAEYGFDPVRLVDLKSLMGDSSDNIPGVAGIGPKTATGLLLEYGTLDGIYEHLPEIKVSVRKKLEKDREQAYLSYDLATIRKNAPVDFIPERNLVREVDNDALYALFLSLIHISEPTRQAEISYAVFCLKKKKTKKQKEEE